MHVVATAGHVDHGKSTLVRALTGMDPDRLEEERRRGLSIELGYCWTELDGVGDVAFVDVPGHQRFITTTLAGVGPVPVGMLVVAADDPWMPQAAEHLAALDALGVTHGVVVVTRADLADPAAAADRAHTEVSRTSLAGAPVVVVSGRTGSGVDLLRRVLADVLAAVPTPDPKADVRLWVDRSFHVRGIGAVVTGTLPAGTVAVGDVLASGDDTVRVRGIEALGRPRDRVSGVARVALDLGGRAPAGITRGTTLVTPGAFLQTTLVDVRVTGSGRLPERPVLHIGAAHTSVHARPLGADFARVTLDRALPLRVGDRALLRDPGNRSVWGVLVVDPLPPALGRRGAASARAVALTDHDGSASAELRLRGLCRKADLRKIGVLPAALPPGTVSTDDWLVDPGLAARLRHDLTQLVRASSTRLSPGVTTAAAAHELSLPDPALVAALAGPPLRLDRGRVVEGRAEPGAAQRKALVRLRNLLAASPFRAPETRQLQELGLDEATVAALHRDGHVLRLAHGVVLLPGADDAAVERLSGLEQPFTASDARRALDTSRRVALPLLAHLDSTGRTLRLPDDRRRVRSRRGPASP